MGKTCVVSRMLDENFLLEYRATVEDLHSGRRFEFDGRPVTLDILDTSGTDEFPAMRRLSIATGDAFILVYDVSDPASFRAVERLRRQIADEKAADERIPVVVVGNKTDLAAQGPEDGGSSQQRRRAVERATAETTAAIDWGYGYVEVSAKDDRNIAGIFRELLAQINFRTDEDESEAGGRGSEGRSRAGHSSRDASKTRHSSLKDQYHQRKGIGGAKRGSCRVS